MPPTAPGRGGSNAARPSGRGPVRKLANKVVADLVAALHAFKDQFNGTWIMQRHDYRTPRQQRAFLLADAAEAAA